MGRDFLTTRWDGIVKEITYPGQSRCWASLGAFGACFEAHYEAGLRCKIGLSTVQQDDMSLIADLLGAMQTSEVDFTLFFRRLSTAIQPVVYFEKVTDAARTRLSGSSD